MSSFQLGSNLAWSTLELECESFQLLSLFVWVSHCVLDLLFFCQSPSTFLLLYAPYVCYLYCVSATASVSVFWYWYQCLSLCILSFSQCHSVPYLYSILILFLILFLILLPNLICKVPMGFDASYLIRLWYRIKHLIICQP